MDLETFQKRMTNSVINHLVMLPAYLLLFLTTVSFFTIPIPLSKSVNSFDFGMPIQENWSVLRSGVLWLYALMLIVAGILIAVDLRKVKEHDNSFNQHESTQHTLVSRLNQYIPPIINGIVLTSFSYALAALFSDIRIIIIRLLQS